MFYTDDPVADFDRYDMAMAQREAKLPICEKCGKPIYERYFEIDNEILCEKCMDDEYGRSTEDWFNDHY